MGHPLTKYFYNIPECANDRVSEFVPSLGLFLFILSNFNMLVFVLTYMLLFYYYPLKACSYQLETEREWTPMDGIEGGLQP